MLQGAMASPEVLAKDLPAELDRKVVAPLFAKYRPERTADSSVPPVVLERRFRRARGRIVDALASRGSSMVPKSLRSEVEALVREWAAVAFGDSFGKVEQFEVRCAREYDLVAARESGDPERLLAALEQDYRRKVVEQFGRIELRGVQTSHRVVQELEAVYVPLHLEAQLKEIADEEGKRITLVPGRRLAVQDVLAANRQVMIVGAPGSGKSTLVAYLAATAAQGRLARQIGEREDPLPLVVAVRALKGASLDVSHIAKTTGCDADLVRRASRQGRALVLVDGLDEASPDVRELLVTAIRELIASHPEMRLIVTSRPAGPPGEVEKSLDVLQPFSLVDLTRQEVDAFIAKWCIAAERSVRSDAVEADREAEKAAADLTERLGKSYPVQRIATNPLLVTILCVVHRFLGRTIPEHRVTLYDRCTDALLYEWDRAKFEAGAAIGQLDASAKRRLLMGIAREIHLAHEAEINEAEVATQFARVLPDLGRPATDAGRIVAEIRDRSGLLVERRPGFFAFSHLTFQEYFCALDFVRAKSLSELVGHYEDTWWHEVIVLASGMPGGGGGSIARKLLAKRSPAAIFLAAQCVETATDMPLQLRERIDKAIQRFVPPKTFAEAARLGDLGAVAAPLLVRALKTDDVEAKALILIAISKIDFEPAIPAIATCMSDSRFSEWKYMSEENDGVKGRIFSIGGLAAVILAAKAESSEIARIALKQLWDTIPMEDRPGISRILAPTSSTAALPPPGPPEALADRR
jgi:hypothetical protein